MKVYLASPLGFAESTRLFMEEMEERLSAADVTLLNPWRNPTGAELTHALMIEDKAERVERLRCLNSLIAKTNEQQITECDLMIAVLDGVDVDSGTASEVGFAYARGKRVFGLRTDFRPAGDNEAATVNLQVQYWIEQSGGTIVHSLPELVRLVPDQALAAKAI